MSDMSFAKKNNTIKLWVLSSTSSLKNLQNEKAAIPSWIFDRECTTGTFEQINALTIPENL